MEKIGLFPLGIVLFPESLYPLHIFEERYKLLINRCYHTNTEFGVCLVAQSKMKEIGCKAKIAGIMNKYDDGRMDILVQGTERFSLNNFTEGEEPYYVGEVEPYSDEDFNIDKGLLADCTKLFNKIAASITTVKVEKIEEGKMIVNYPSFFIAQKAGFPAEKKQQLLEMQTENLRLRFLLTHLNNILPAIKDSSQVQQIIKNDGYYSPDTKF